MSKSPKKLLRFLGAFNIGCTHVAPIYQRSLQHNKNKKGVELAPRLMFRLAGAVGIEPTTNGFGVRYHTHRQNRETPVFMWFLQFSLSPENAYIANDLMYGCTHVAPL